MAHYQAKATSYENGTYEVQYAEYDYEGNPSEHVHFLIDNFPIFFDSTSVSSIEIYDENGLERIRGGFGGEYDAYQGWRFWELTAHAPDCFEPIEL